MWVNGERSKWRSVSVACMKSPAVPQLWNPQRLMLPKHLKSDQKTLSLLQKCHLTVPHLTQIHAHLVVSGRISDPFAAGKLAAALAAADLRRAHHLLRSLSHPTTFVWNAMIRAHTEKKDPMGAFSLYILMLAANQLPNNYTFSFLLRSCIDLSSISDGRRIHAQIVKLGWESYDFVHNGLIHMYTTCGCIQSARRIFDSSLNKDVVSWTAMINGYAKTWQIDLARELFDRMPERNAVSWSTMITSYAQIGMFGEAVGLFKEMQTAGVRPNHAGVVGALSACGFLGALDQGRWIHAFVERSKMELDTVLGTALIDMYAKCGCVGTAWQVFDAMPERDVFAYTAMISGFSNHGESKRAVDLFIKMQEEGVTPNEVTFICVISACGRMGLVNEGQEFFESMSDVYGITPGVEHYGCLVDLLGRAGLLDEAKRVVMEMPMEPDSYVLGALLNACGVNGEVNSGKDTVESLVELGLDHSGVHVLMSNMYASAFRWDDVMKVRKKMEEKNVRKIPGCSMIEVNGVAWEFVSGERSHPFMEEVTLLLRRMNKQLKSFGNDVLQKGLCTVWIIGD